MPPPLRPFAVARRELLPQLTRVQSRFDAGHQMSLSLPARILSPDKRPLALLQCTLPNIHLPMEVAGNSV